MYSYLGDFPTGATIFFPFHTFNSSGASVTLTGLAVGLGALYPNFKEDNPSKIVSGFGGTFCLVLSFIYILGSVVLLAMATPWTPARAPSSVQKYSSSVSSVKRMSFGLLSGWPLIVPLPCTQIRP